MKSYILKENHIGSAVSEINWYKQKDKHAVTINLRIKGQIKNTILKTEQTKVLDRLGRYIF